MTRGSFWSIFLFLVFFRAITLQGRPVRTGEAKEGPSHHLRGFQQDPLTGDDVWLSALRNLPIRGDNEEGTGRYPLAFSHLDHIFHGEEATQNEEDQNGLSDATLSPAYSASASKDASEHHLGGRGQKLPARGETDMQSPPPLTDEQVLILTPSNKLNLAQREAKKKLIEKLNQGLDLQPPAPHTKRPPESYTKAAQAGETLFHGTHDGYHYIVGPSGTYRACPAHKWHESEGAVTRRIKEMGNLSPDKKLDKLHSVCVTRKRMRDLEDTKRQAVKPGGSEKQTTHTLESSEMDQNGAIEHWNNSSTQTYLNRLHELKMTILEDFKLTNTERETLSAPELQLFNCKPRELNRSQAKDLTNLVLKFSEQRKKETLSLSLVSQRIASTFNSLCALLTNAEPSRNCPLTASFKMLLAEVELPTLIMADFTLRQGKEIR
ncbi:hypothetical protein FA10DRAFT_257917 [Acaromyces ingoldii]|uniref:Uncharacterized protein n=1 Tax=Acaromyces ingoldii TaxID=215250 RepID=A0A316YVT8_9BASI|nr:hypothetical protein FA10DRAFT_257917 [Acaromyces ingoldii]PWN93670.1 hypothetical protein FA10DRAFT_257917 [Acaromyces ingoldii]